jgi:PTS system mannitol-specific IIA component
MPEYVSHILHSGIVVAQYPKGVDFGSGNIAKLVIGIAGKGDDHMTVLSRLAEVCMEMENVNKLASAESAEEIMKIIGVEG